MHCTEQHWRSVPSGRTVLLDHFGRDKRFATAMVAAIQRSFLWSRVCADKNFRVSSLAGKNLTSISTNGRRKGVWVRFCHGTWCFLWERACYNPLPVRLSSYKVPSILCWQFGFTSRGYRSRDWPWRWTQRWPRCVGLPLLLPYLIRLGAWQAVTSIFETDMVIEQVDRRRCSSLVHAIHSCHVQGPVELLESLVTDESHDLVIGNVPARKGLPA